MVITIVALDVRPVGGMERQLTELVSGLLSAGDRVIVVSRTCDLTPHPRLRWVRIPGPARPFSFTYPWFVLVATAATAHVRRGILHTTGALVANRADVSTVHLFHRAIRSVDIVRSSRPTALYRFNARVTSVMATWAERYCYRPERTGLLVAVSSGVAAELREYLPRMRSRVITIPNGVDSEAFAPDPAVRPSVREELGLDPLAFIALFVGSEWSGKGLGVALEAVVATPGCHLVVVGSGDARRYAQRARDLGAGDRVHLVGTVPQPVRYYQAADVFLFPSAYETFSLVAHEAAAAGLPLLTARVSGIEDILVDGRNGWFIERTVDSIAPRLAQLRDQPELRARMGAASRLAVASRDWQSMTDGYREAYRSIVSARVAS